MSFICADCGQEFTLPDSVRARYPNWTPRQCMDCRGRPAPIARERLTTQQTLDRYTSGPDSGVFTDGFCEPNPGAGGWGAVKVVNGEITAERHGTEPATTNNRMELTALIEGYRLIDAGEQIDVFTDSELCVKTINEWADAWAAKGWRRKGGEIKNLDLVQQLYRLARERPGATLRWIKGHAGSRWNEYADALSRHGADHDAG